MTYEIDHIDAKILKLLQVNARITNQQLAQEVGLSPAATLERVKKLEAFEIITSYHARISAEKLGFEVECLVFLTLENLRAETLEALKQKLIAYPEIIEACVLSGRKDLVLKVIVQNMSSYHQFLTQKLAVIPSVKHIQSSFIFEKLKSSQISLFPFR